MAGAVTVPVYGTHGLGRAPRNLNAVLDGRTHGLLRLKMTPRISSLVSGILTFTVLISILVSEFLRFTPLIAILVKRTLNFTLMISILFNGILGFTPLIPIF
jgi:hypothetical protein